MRLIPILPTNYDEISFVSENAQRDTERFAKFRAILFVRLKGNENGSFLFISPPYFCLQKKADR